MMRAREKSVLENLGKGMRQMMRIWIGIGIVSLLLACGSSNSGTGQDLGPGSDGSSDGQEDTSVGETSDSATTDEGADPGPGTDVASETSSSDSGEDVAQDIGTDAPTTDVGSDTGDPPEDVAVDEGSPPGPFTGFPIDVPEANTSNYFFLWFYGMTVDAEGRVSILWQGTSGADSNFLLSRTNIDVSAFEPADVVDTGFTGEIGADVITDGTDQLIVWRRDNDAGGDDIIFRRGTMPGVIGDDITVFSDNFGVNNHRPHMARDPSSGTIVVLWQREQDVVISRSTDDGLTFSTPPNPVTPSNLQGFISAVAFNSGGTLVVTFHGSSGGGTTANTVYGLASDDFGLSFTEAVDLGAMAGGDGPHLRPSMAPGTDGKVHAVWHRSGQGANKEAFKSSTYDGVTWDPPTALDHIKYEPYIRAGRGSQIHLSGLNNPPIVDSGTGEEPGVPIYVSSPNDGLTFGDPAVIPSTETFTIVWTDMAANLDTGYLHVAWWEYKGNQNKIRLITVDP